MTPPNSSRSYLPTMRTATPPAHRDLILNLGTTLGEADSSEPEFSLALPAGFLAGTGRSRSILGRSAEEFRSALAPSPASTEDPLTAARAFFTRPVPDSPNLDYLEEAWRHYQAVLDGAGRTEVTSALSASLEASSWLDQIRHARAVFGDAGETCPSVGQSHRALAVVAEMDAAFLSGDYPNDPTAAVDRLRLTNDLRTWARSLTRHDADPAQAVAAFGRIAELARSSHLNELLHGEIRSGVQELYSRLMHPAADATPEQQVQSHSLALQLMTGALGTLGTEARNDFLDARNAILADADRLETELSRAPDAPSRLQILGTLASLYRQLRRDSEGGTDVFMAERYQRTLTAIRANARDAAVPPSLRAQVIYQTAIQIGRDGDETRCLRWISELRGEADSLILRAHAKREPFARIELLQQALALRTLVGDRAEREEVRGQLRTVLALVESQAGRLPAGDSQRQAQAFLAEAYVGLEDWDAALRVGEALRSSLHTSPAQCRETGEAEGLRVEDHAVWLLRLGDLYQRVANGRVAGTSTPPDFSHFREVLSDLSALGAQHSQRSMVLYSRFMGALLDNDPEAARLYQELQDWRPEAETRVETPPATEEGTLILVGGTPSRLPNTLDFLQGAREPYSPDLFQNLAARVYQGPRAVQAAERSALTLHWLSLMIEGNYSQRIHAASEDEEDTSALRRERDDMRETLRQVQGLISSGRAGNTHDAIRALAEATGNPEAPGDFYHRLGMIFSYTNLDGSSVGITSAIADLIETETISDPNFQASRRLSIAREMIRDDSLNHRCDSAIASILAAVESSGQPGYAPPPALHSLTNILRDNRNLDDIFDLYNRLAGNRTLGRQVAATRSFLPYWQTANEAVDHLFSVEGGAIVLTSLFTAGLTAELAAAGLTARLGTAALTWGGRATIGLARFGAMYATLNLTQIGLSSGYRALEGRPMMTPEQVQGQLIGSAFSLGVGEIFSAPAGAVAGRIFGTTSRVAGVARFMAFNAGMIEGEDLAADLTGAPRSSVPFGVRYFRASLDGAALMAGSHLAHGVLAMPGREGIRVLAESESRTDPVTAERPWRLSLERWQEAFRRHALGMAFLFTGTSGIAIGGIPSARRGTARRATPRTPVLELAPVTPETQPERLPDWRSSQDLREVIETSCLNQEVADVEWPTAESSPDSPLTLGPVEGLPETSVNGLATVLSEAMELTETPIPRVHLRLRQITSHETLQAALSLARHFGTEVELSVGSSGETVRISANRGGDSVRVHGLSSERVAALRAETLPGSRLVLRLTDESTETLASRSVELTAANPDRNLVVENARGETLLESGPDGLRLNADRLPTDILRHAVQSAGSRPVRILVRGVERVVLSSSSGRSSVNVELRGADAEAAAETLHILSELPSESLQGASVQVQNLSAEASSANRQVLARLTRHALQARVERLFVLFAGVGGRAGEPLIRLRRNPSAIRLLYEFNSSSPISEITQVAAEYFAFETAQAHPDLLASYGEVSQDGTSSLVRMWAEALNHAEGFSRRGNERETYQGYWSDPSSLGRWVQGLQTLVSFARSSSANGAVYGRAIQNILNFSQPEGSTGLLGYRPFEGRALGDNAFELMRIGAQEQGTTFRALQQIAEIMGRFNNIEVGGAFVGIIYKATVLGDGPARHELEAFADQIREAQRLSSQRFRITVLPEDRNTTVRTPEWVLESLDTEGRPTQLIAAEVKARNVTRMTDRDAEDMIRNASAQLTTHPFTDGMAQPQAMLILRLTESPNRGNTSSLIRRLLAAEYARLSSSGEPAMQHAAARMSRMAVRIYFEAGERGAGSSTLLEFRNGQWETTSGRSSALAATLATGTR